MRAIGIKALKAKLSEYVRLAKAGETILVTERDQVVAELRPARRQNLGERTVDDWLDHLADAGAATLASASPGDWSGFTAQIKLDGLHAEGLLDELRADVGK
jgi:antitoxin (DNA-binding transcriptional repressor) of toxin-antitoxin stability system